LAGAVPAIAGSLPIYSSLDWTGRLLFKSVLGGLASVAGGGKFANGAVTGAFQYLFNDQFHDRAAAIAADDVPGMTAPHYYLIDPLMICSFSDPACTFENAHISAMATQIPGYAGMTVNEGVYPVSVPNFGFIGNVMVYDNGSSITNETLPGHTLYYGFVTRTIEVGSDGIYIGGYGMGQNIGGPVVALFNQVYGPGLWAQQGLLTRDYFNRNFSSGARSQ
jgi:hypothetical protein